MIKIESTICTHINLHNFIVLFIIFCVNSFSQDFPEYGKYPVGFRIFEKYDYSRTLFPKNDFENKAYIGETSTPIQINIWYPSINTNDNKITYKDYIFFDLKKDDFSTDPSTVQILTEFKRRILMGLSEEVSDSTAEIMINNKTHASLNAEYGPGPFPLIIAGQDAGPFGNSILFEFLASHGFVVISSPTLSKTAAVQISNTQQAIETRVRNMEFIHAFARELPSIDKNRTVVLGVNFDGMSGLIFQMRNMAADAVISLDGWEGKKLGSDRIQGSIYFDIIKMRVPYLCFQQDNPPMQDLKANSEIVDLLKYSERYFYVLKNLEHPDYTLNKIAFSKNNNELIQSYKFMYSTVLNFLNKYTKGNGDKINLNHDEEILKMSLSANALPSVPTQLEFENIIMNEKDISKAVKVFRDSKKNNHEINIFTEQTINTYAFRFKRMSKPKEALELYKLNCEAFPTSSNAFNNLGDGYKLNKDKINAVECYKKSIELISKSDLHKEQKDQMIISVQNKINELGETQ